AGLSRTGLSASELLLARLCTDLRASYFLADSQSHEHGNLSSAGSADSPLTRSPLLYFSGRARSRVARQFLLVGNMQPLLDFCPHLQQCIPRHVEPSEFDCLVCPSAPTLCLRRREARCPPTLPEGRHNSLCERLLGSRRP